MRRQISTLTKNVLTYRLKNESPKYPALVSIFMRGRGLERVRRQRSACENYSTPYHGVK